VKSTVEVRRDGVITVPKPIRDAMDISEGDIIEIDVLEVKKQTKKE